MADEEGSVTPGAKEEAPPLKSTNLESFGPAKDRIRDTLKWIIGVYGAIAAVFVAGASITGLATVETGGTRFWLALVGLALTLLAISVIVWLAARVLAGSGLSVIDLARAQLRLADTDDSESEAAPTVQKLASGHQTAVVRREHEAIVGYLAGQPQLLFGAASISEVAEHFLQSRRDSDYEAPAGTEDAVAQLRTVGGWQQVVYRFGWAMRGLIAGTIATAIGIGLFVWSTSPPQPSQHEIASAVANEVDTLLKAIGAVAAASPAAGELSSPESFIVIADPELAAIYSADVDPECVGVGGFILEASADESGFVIPPVDECPGMYIPFDNDRVLRGIWDAADISERGPPAFGSAVANVDVDAVVIVDPDLINDFWDDLPAQCDPADIITILDTSEGSDLQFYSLPAPSCPTLEFELSDGVAEVAHAVNGGETGIDP